MPVCFQLYRKGEVNGKPLSLSLVDEEICKRFNVEPDPVRYVAGWYDCIGFRLACGKSFEDIRTTFAEYIRTRSIEGRIPLSNDNRRYYVTQLRILQFMAENYSPDCWREVGRRD